MSEKPKIGIFTLHRALNYGAVWQCYALKCACELLGYEAETIDYNPYGDYEARWFIGGRPSKTYRYWRQMYQFNRFVKQCLNPTQHTVSHDWIKNNPPKDDVYIVGSDTVWSNEVTGDFLNSYLLDFAPSNVKRISYAASTGGCPMKLNEYQLGELRNFSAISVREHQTVPTLQAMVDLPVVDVCDPTLLLKQENYESLEQRPLGLPRHYVVYFDLAGCPLCAESLQEISRNTHLPILNLAGNYKRWAQYNRLAPTPEQWLYILHHADFLCTNSFHGVAFSIIFRRPFVCCEAQVGGRAKTNGRVINLLDQTHLMDRYVTSIDQVNLIADQNIKFDDMAIEAYRNRSLQWLKNAIE